MKPVPTSFHLGPFNFHTYGFGLAIAAYVAYWYAERRLEKRGVGATHFGAFAAIMLVLGVLGARLAHVFTNWSIYHDHLTQIFSVWQGGLSSFGGILLAAPVGYVLVKKWWPRARVLAFADALIPAMVAGWAIGRCLGPQFMVNGGGHLTHQWFGLSYAGQTGERVPVPLIQGLEDGSLWLLILAVERVRATRLRTGTATGLALIIWGLVRSLDERLLLGEQGHTGSVAVQIAGLALTAIGVVVVVFVAAKSPKPLVSD